METDYKELYLQKLIVDRKNSITLGFFFIILGLMLFFVLLFNETAEIVSFSTFLTLLIVGYGVFKVIKSKKQLKLLKLDTKEVDYGKGYEGSIGEVKQTFG